MKRNILVLAVFGVALAVAGFFAGTGSQASPPADKFINLATAGAEVTHNGALFTQGGIGAGTGNFNPFLTLSPGGSANTEQGYNSVKGTPGIPQFDEFYGGGRTQAIQAAAIPAFDPPPVGGPLYRVILLDANDRGSDAYNSLDTLKVFLDNQPNLAQYNNNANTFGTDDGTKASLIFNMDDNCPGGDCVALLLSQGLEPGSGISDISVALPDSLFPPECYYGSQTCNEWFYLFTQMGGYVDNGTDPVAGTQNWNVTAGFEEWRTELVPVVNVTKTAAVSYKITYDWTLEKEVSKDGGNTWEKAPSATIEVGDSQNYLWRLVATRLPGVVSQQVVSGTVTITNPTGGAVITKPIPATITSIVDAIDTPDIPDVALTCGGVAYTGQAITLGAGQTLTCTYSVAAPGATNTTTGTNTVTVAVQDAGTDFVATAGFKFADATVTEIDEQALLQDPEVTPDQLLSETPAEPFQSSTQTYTCGSTNTIVNSGKLTETDSGQVRPSSAQITIICVDARIDLTPITWTNEVNSPHTVTCSIKQDDGLKPAEGGDAVDGLGPAPNGTVCTLSLLPPNTAGASFVGGVNTCSTTGGSCTVQINATKAGRVVIHGTTTFLVGGVSLTRSTNTAGNGTDAEKIYVNARIDLTPITWTNEVNSPHTVTCLIKQDDGLKPAEGGDAVDGLGPAPNGTVCTLSLLNNTAGASFVGGVNTCSTTGGSCTVQINATKAGSVDIHGTTTFLVGGVSLTRSTNTAGNGTDVKKIYVNARIDLTPITWTNEVNSPHTVTCLIKQDDGLKPAEGGDAVDGLGPAPNGTVCTLSLLNNTAGASFVGGVNTCSTSGGTCTVQINASSAGSVDIHGTTTFLVGGVSLTRSTNTAGNGTDVEKIYVNAHIDLTPITWTNEVKSPHTVTCSIKQDDGLKPAEGGDAVDGLGPAPNGTVCTLSLLNNTAGASFVGGVNTCSTSGGTCTVQINASSAGSVDIHGTTTFLVGGVSLTRSTNTAGNGTDVEKIYVNARIDLTPITWTNKVNSPHTVTCSIKQDDGLKPAEGGDAVDGLGPAPNGTVCTLSLLNNTAGASFVGGVNTCSTSGGSCTVQINATSAGSVDIHGTTTFLVGGVSLTRSTNTAGNGTDVEKIYVDARISIAESGTNGITEPHTFTVKVEKNDGSGWVAAADETVTASETGVGDITGGTCDGVDADTDINGQCTIIVNSATAGSSTVNAAATVNVLGVDIDVATDGYGAFYVSNVKTWVDGSLRWEKRSASSTGPLLGGATFEACRTHDRFGNDIADECVTVVDDVDTVPGPGPDMDPDAGEFMLDNLKLGRWTIRETVTPPGYVGDPFIETIELTLASPDKTATHIWVNTPAQGCTPGFWGGGAGSVLWDGKDDTIVTTLVDAFVALGMTPLQAEDVLNIDGSNKGPHFASWYEVFAVPSLMRLADHSGDNLTDPLTLYDTTPQGGKASGGDAGKLARFATASLLNATAREAGLMPAYAFDVATVLDMVQDAWAAHLLGDDATMSAIANELAAASNLFCPLP